MSAEHAAPKNGNVLFEMITSKVTSDKLRAQMALQNVTPERLARVAWGALMKTPKLLQATQESVMFCIAECARLGLEPERLSSVGATSDWQRIKEKAEKLYDMPFFIDDRPGLGLSEIIALVRSQVKRHGVKVVFIDQVSIVDAELPSPTATKRDEISTVCRRFKQTARELDIVIVLLSQVNRAAVPGAQSKSITEEGLRKFRPAPENLKESGGLEEDADVVILLHQPGKLIAEEDAERLGIIGKAEWIIAKNRHGKSGVVKMRFKGSYFRFTEEEDVTPQRQETTPDNAYVKDFDAFSGKEDESPDGF